MKFNIELDITPQEVRQVLGMPDIEEMQKGVVDKVQEKLFKAIDDASNVESLFEQFIPLGTGSLQKFMGMMAKMAPGESSQTSKKSSK